MKSWKIVKPKEVELVSASGGVYDKKFVKVKIARAGISNTDVTILKNSVRGVDFPVTLSRQGMGLVSEILENEKGLKRSDRVYISPYQACGICAGCMDDKPHMCDNLKIRGQHIDGLLADFVIVPADSLYLLPESVDKDKAMFIEYAAIAKSTLDRMKIKKGEHVIIMGASKIGNILAQLAIYYQSVPILVDDDKEALAYARQNGVYYTVDTKTQNVKKTVKELTGNRMAENVIFVSLSNYPVSEALELTSYNGRAAIIGNESNKIEGDLSAVLENQLSLIGVNNGYENIPSAINLLANKKINVTNLIKETISFDSVPEKLREISSAKRISYLQTMVDCM